MHPAEQKILQTFAKNPLREISTSELVRLVFSKEYDEAQKYVHNATNDSEIIRLGKRKKARLHRKILYHLNKLTEENLLLVTKMEGKGEKFFSLNPEKTVEGKRDKAIKTVFDSVSNLNEEVFMLSGLESYEEAKFVKKFDSKNWVNKINALIVESQAKPNLKDLYSMISGLYPVFNDVLGVNCFNLIIDKENLQDLNNFIKKADMDTKDYNKYLNLIIDLEKIKDSVKLTDFISGFAEINPERIFLIFRMNSKTLNSHLRFVKQLIKNFSENKIRINIQNTDLKIGPSLIGRAGCYSLTNEEWDFYLKQIKGETIGLCLSETAVYVDVYRFFKSGKSVSEFRDFLLKASRALLLATTTLRKRSDMFFRELNGLNGNNQSKFFSLSYNYIRLWNYSIAEKGDVEEEGYEFENFELLIRASIDEINEFCKSEETIFKSCGIPIRFRIALSSTFKRFDEEFLSPRIYTKITIKNIEDFKDEKVVKYLRRRESLVKLFNGADRARFFRAANFTNEEVINELEFLLSQTTIPLFAYDFRSRKGELTLDNFI